MDRHVIGHDFNFVSRTETFAPFPVPAVPTDLRAARPGAPSMAAIHTETEDQ